MIGRNYLVSSVLLLASTIIAAAGWIFSMKSLEGLPPVFFIAVRFLFAGLVVGAAGFAPTGRIDPRELARGLVPGAFLAAAMMMWIMGLRYTDNLGVGSFICALGNILAPLAGRILYRWRVPLGTRIAGAVAMVGMGFLFLQNGTSLSLGDSFFLGSALASSVNLVLTSRCSPTMSVATLTSVQLLVTGIASFLVSAAIEPWHPAWPTGATIGWVLASILLATSLRFFLQMKAQSLAPVAHTALLMCLEPVWTTLIATTWLKTTMSAFQMTGCALIFVALIINRWDAISGLWRADETPA